MTGKTKAPFWWTRGDWCWISVLKDADAECVNAGDGALLSLRENLLEQFGPCCWLGGQCNDTSGEEP